MRREAIYTTFSATMRVRDSPREGEIWSREEAATVSMVARNIFLATALPLVRLSRLAERARNTACRLLAPVAVSVRAPYSPLYSAYIITM